MGIVEYIYPESNEAILLYSPRKIILKSTLSPDGGASLLIHTARPPHALVERQSSLTRYLAPGTCNAVPATKTRSGLLCKSYSAAYPIKSLFGFSSP